MLGYDLSDHAKIQALAPNHTCIMIHINLDSEYNVPVVVLPILLYIMHGRVMHLIIEICQASVISLQPKLHL